MIDKDPTTYGVLTYLWVLGLAMLGGLAAFIQRLNKSSKPQPLKTIFLKLAGELVIAAFAGLLTFWLCQAWGLDGTMSALAVGVSGHMGGKAIDGIGRIWLAAIKDKGGA